MASALSLGLLVGCAAPGQLRPADGALIAGRTFVVTGASSGLGRGVAVKLGSYGGNVVLAARRGDVLEQVAAEVRGAGGEALVVPTDTSRVEEVEALGARAVARFGRIDAWVNDAAVASIGRFEDVPLADHARIVDVNLKGYIYGSHVALRQFRAQGFGTLVNVASVEGRVPLAYHASYAATKAAVVGLDIALNQELRLNGADRIHVSSVLPWAVDTPFWDHTGNYSGGTPRVYTMDDPSGTVDAIVWMTIHPQKEYAVGFKASGAVFGERVWPAMAERMAADLVHQSQITTAPPAAATSGSVHRPMAAGTAVEGGTRARMEREDRARAAGASVN